MKNRLYQTSYNIIDDLSLLQEIKKSDFTKKDARAGWIGPGLPFTNNSNFKNIARWALQQWAIYTGFFPEIKNPQNILDIGSGMGYATRCLIDIFNCPIYGIDNDEDSSIFSNRYNGHPLISFLNINFEDFEITKKFSYIFALEVLEHIPAKDHFSFIDKCLLHLNPHGKLFISTPNENGPDIGAHRGILNNERARAFIEHYKDKIVSIEFFDNNSLDSETEDFIIHDGFENLTSKNKNRSHFKIIMA